ncbi:septin-6-like [Zophobas morio]|uniref:septin-6-like n=1 Tax=Zophobas morio TaxID=2755281 RepID=UPI0030829110
MAYCGSHHLALGGGTLELRGHVGFDGLPDQLVNKSVQQGFQFNLLIVGETGCGKTTLINSLFKTEFEELEGLEERTHFTPETWIQSATYDIQEKEVCLRLRIDQTVGFGDAIDRSSSMQLVTDYLNKKFEEYLQEEISITRRRRAFSDPRCHACIYMITPCHNSLKSLDFAMLKAIHKSVNVIPVIAKSDNIDRSTLKKLKINIMKELQDAGISTYNFFTEDCGELQAVAPFSIVASNEVIDGRRVRIYPWGTVDIENEDHSDFATLRECLLRYSIYNLIYQTSAVFYSSYRMKRLREMGFLETTDGE